MPDEPVGVKLTFHVDPQKKDADNFISTSFKSVSIGIYNYLLFTSRFFIARTFSGSPNRVMNPLAS